MLPPVGFAGEHQAVAALPVDHAAARVFRHIRKRILQRRSAMPDFVRTAVLDVGDPDGPGMRTVRLNEIAIRSVSRHGGLAHKRYVLAVERPHRVAIRVHRRRQKFHVLRIHVVNSDETVITAIGHEQQASAVL